MPDYLNFDDARGYGKGMPSSFPPQSIKVRQQGTKGSKRLEESAYPVELKKN